MDHAFSIDDIDDTVLTITNGLSALIIRAAQVESQESVNPGYHGPDQMDHKLKFFGERKERLRKIRQDFEDVMAESSAYPT